jgi:hypothetical protein
MCPSGLATGKRRRVLAVGSIFFSNGLDDPSMAVTFRNALHHMAVVFGLNVSAIGQDGHFLTESLQGEDHGRLEW